MNYYPGGQAPAGYAVAASDKPGLYAASPYAAMASPYATAQPGLPPGMQQYAAARQQYAVVSQASPYTSTQPTAAAYYASAGAAGYPAGAGVPLSSLQMMSSAQQQAYLGAQYPGGMGVQRAMMGPTSVAAAGYGGSPLYAASSYTGLTAMPAQPSRSPYAVAQVGYATAANLPPSASNPGPGYASAYGLPY
ncbi:TSC22 domain family protein 2-like isoform X2 [Littorina saxatilis]|uniref:Uncharacterized protein n=2 Tax=Littorina saxatilis TaxID=31220 RepID=A0AAN9BZQ0_9CAEN